MRKYTPVIEKDEATGLYVGYVPGLEGAHSQGKTLDELQVNLQQVIEMLLEDEGISLQARAQRGSREQFLAILQKAPDVEPEEHDKL